MKVQANHNQNHTKVHSDIKMTECTDRCEQAHDILVKDQAAKN